MFVKEAKNEFRLNKKSSKLQQQKEITVNLTILVKMTFKNLTI